MAYLLYFLLICGMVYSVPLTEKEQCGYVGCPKTDPNVLNVHIVPHTHDDVGWLKTVDQYYYGSRNNIQKAGVQYIIDSVVSELWEDPRRKFIYVETAFFWKWWMRQSIEKQTRVQRLVRDGRLQFVGGAWSMNDEAAAHYHSTVDQFTWGLSKINETFGPCALPKVGWQIDPFGHSREFASLLAAMGYDGLFLGRIDYQDKRARLRDRTMEMVWRGDDDLGSASDIFTGILYNTYSPPPGFCFDVLCSDEPIVDDPDSPMFNVDEKIDLFLSYVMHQAKSYTTNNVLITMGGDFTYQDARMWYTNLDKLIGYTNLKAGKDQLNIKLYYSTPNCYLKSVKESNPILPMKTDDFFPYASDPNSYWTGYFTSRPTTKYFERQGNMFLQMVKQLQVLADLEKHNIFVLNQLKSAMGVMQHHDAITGTEKQHVTRDYERILSQAVQDAAIIARQAFSKTIRGEAASLYRYDICRLNESSCDASENSRHFQVTLYNPLAWDVDHPVRIPVVDGVYEVYAPNSDKIDFQLLEIPQQILNLPNRVSRATHELNFIAYLHPLMIKSFYVKKVDSQRQERMTNRKNERFHRSNYETTDSENKGPVLDRFERESENVIPTNSNKNFKKENSNFDEHVNELVKMIKDIRDSTHRQGKSEDVFYRQNVDNLRMLSDDPSVIERLEDFFSISNDKMQINFDNASGEIKSIRNPNRSTNLTIGFYYYPGYVGNNGEPANRSSGAYIFRPSTIHPIKIDRTDYKVVTGKVVKQMSMSFEHNVHVSMRLYDAIDYLEIDYIVGPIDVEDGVGKEYIIKYGTDIINNGEFYTDSNGRQIIKRKLNYRPEFNVTLAEPVGGNYYPINNNIFIKNDIKIFSVATDRSQGGSSLAEGEVELMLHRRLLHDDAFGVDEALNETVNGKGLVVKGTHRLHLYSNNDQEQLKSVINMDLQPIIFVSEANNLELEDWLKTKNCFSWLKTPLPVGVHLLTLEPWNDHLLLRLENYLKKSDDSSKEIDLNNLFVNVKVNSYKETVLSGNQWLNKYEKWYWDTNSVDNVCNKRQSELRDENFKIVLNAKEIRTFIIDYEIV